MNNYKPWGYHLTLDLYNIVHDRVTDIDTVREFVESIIPKIGMKAHGACHVERFGEGHLNGISAMQFIETSSITVHTDEVDNRVFIDIFSCKNFNSTDAIGYALGYFGAQEFRSRFEAR